MKQLTLPNGDTLYYIDKLTALYVYNEIYVDKVYLYGGLTVKEGDVIFDIGANIGVFSRFITTQAPDLKVFAFEPIRPIFEVLQANLEEVNAEIKNYNIGLGKKEEDLEITYYPKLTGDSAIISFDWDYKVNRYVEKYKETIAKDIPLARIVPRFLRRRVVEAGLKRMYKGEKLPCHIRRLSDIIKENNIDRIDLMKIDAENYEWQVLVGIDNEDWDKIKQIAMEVHTHIKGGRNLMMEITDLLESKGFSTYEGEESRETLMGVYMLYGKRE